MSRRTYALLLAGAGLFAILLAWSRFATVTMEPGGRLEDPDAMFHAHRVERTIAEGKVLPPVLDPWESFPAGGRALWPPLHDATLALVARLGGSTAAAPRRGFPLAAAVPVVEVVLALLVAALLARRVAGERAGALAAWLFALTPCIPLRGAFGEIDHNLTEVLGALLLLLLADTLARRHENRLRGPRGPWLSPLLWGGAVLLSLGFHAALVLSAAVAAAALAARDLAGPAPRSLPLLSPGFGLAALALPFFASLRVPADPTDPWRLGPSYVLALGILAVATGLFSLAAPGRGERSRQDVLLSAAGTGAGVLALLATSSLAWPALLRASGFLGSRDPWLATISEFRPLLRNARWAQTALPTLLVALVALALLLSLPKRIRPRAGPDLVFLGVSFTLFALLALVQGRYLPLAVAVGAAAGGAAWELLRGLSVARWTLWGAAALGFFPVAFGHLIPSLGSTFSNSEAPAVWPWEVAAKAIGSVTPDPGNPPAWGVLAWWDFGHAIVFQGGRAVALNNFGGMHPGFEATQRLWLEPSPTRAVEELDRRRIRYVHVIWPPYFVPAAAASLGLDPNVYFHGKWSLDSVPDYRPTTGGERALAVRLHLRNAEPLPDDDPADRSALSRFRLAWSSTDAKLGPAGPLPAQKLFELLPPPPAVN